MSMAAPEVMVVGGGPVGLVAALLAHEAGLRVRLVEARAEPRAHSRAIGIHPPSLALLHGLGLAEPLVERGVTIRGGVARTGPVGEDRSLLGRLDFSLLPPPWNFVLAVPQDATEAILEGALRARDPEIVHRGVEAGRVGPSVDGRVPLELRGERGSSAILHPAFILACDGKGSRMRGVRGIQVAGRSYPHRYLMGDFANPPEGAQPVGFPAPEEALLTLAPRGLVESFPLSPGVRRWVVEREENVEPPLPHRAGEGSGWEGAGPRALRELVDAVEARCGIVLDPGANRMLSAFGVERRIASTAWRDRVVLVGDAAHVISPIGGQGMNLGWLHAQRAVEGVVRVLREGADPDEEGRRYTDGVRRGARRAAARAEWNMALGHRPAGPPGGWRARGHLGLRNAALRCALRSRSVALLLARRFTMHGLAPGHGPTREGRGGHRPG